MPPSSSRAFHLPDLELRPPLPATPPPSSPFPPPPNGPARARGGGAVQRLSLRDWALHAPRRPQGPRGLPVSASLFCGRCSTVRTCHASVRVTRSVCASIRGRGGRPCLSAIQSSRTDLTVITRPRGHHCVHAPGDQLEPQGVKVDGQSGDRWLVPPTRCSLRGLRDSSGSFVPASLVLSTLPLMLYGDPWANSVADPFLWNLPVNRALHGASLLAPCGPMTVGHRAV